jgi:hypothetical protein
MAYQFVVVAGRTLSVCVHVIPSGLVEIDLVLYAIATNFDPVHVTSDHVVTVPGPKLAVVQLNPS